MKKWIEVNKKKPATNKRVYVVCQNEKGKKYQTIASYIPYMTVKEEDFINEDYHYEGDYNETNDEYYTPEGWYEWTTTSELNLKIIDEVVFWMPLFKVP